MKTWIQNARVVLRDRVLENGMCLMENGEIRSVRSCADGGAQQVDGRVIDAGGGYLVPGFIDLHCHGGGGYDFMDATVEQVGEIADFHLAHGTTSLLATTLTAGVKETEAALRACGAFLARKRPSNLCGVHMEGPWLNPKQCGAQQLDLMRLPQPGELKRLKEEFPFLLRVSAAPELPGGMLFGDEGRELGLLVSPAHTDANFKDIEQALEHGYQLMTHLYSGMSGVTRRNAFRTAGAVEAGLYFDNCFVEIIADGRHLPEELLKFIYKCKGADRICLITDATRAAGFPDGRVSVLGSADHGLKILVEDGVAKLPDRSAFAGSVACADRVYRTMARAIGYDMPAVSRMASLTPATVMGWTDRGEIAAGKRADLVLLDEELNVKQVFLKGETV